MGSKLLGIVLLAGVAGAGTYGYNQWCFKSRVKEAKSAIEKGYAAVAAETIDPVRQKLTKSEEDCRMLMNVYFSARMIGSLDWASQACLFSGVEIPEVHIALATAREMAGRPQESLQVLGSVIEKYKDIPDILYRMAQVLSRMGNAQSAAIAYQQALAKAPDNTTILLEGLDYTAGQKLWEAAKPFALRLKDAQTDNPALKLLVARVLMNTGDKDVAKAVVESAKPLLAQAQNKAQLEEAFKDVLK